MTESTLFPTGRELEKILNLQSSVNVDEFLGPSLTDPLQNLFSRPRKNIRCDLVRMGFRIAARLNPLHQIPDLEKVQLLACEVLEILHAGSLIIDDIEDGTEERRGRRALHLQYGLPVALNAGNWLYFLPFQKIEQMPISVQGQFMLSKACQKTLLRAHYGQALDVGVPINRVETSRVREVSLAAMELKSGVLTGFALQMAALAMGCEAPWVEKLEVWGRRLGLALQMFDDIGNLTSKSNPAKRGEDLKLLRPSYIFAVAAELLPPLRYQEFLSLLSSQAPVHQAIEFLQHHQVDTCAQEEARENLLRINENFEKELNLQSDERQILSFITQKLVSSYE